MKLKYIIALIFMLLAGNINSAVAQCISRKEYIDTYKETAIRAMKTHGIPASITLAQGCLESQDGNSDLAVKAHNHFGIKCHKDWKGKTYYKKDDDPHKSCFRSYKNAAASFKDHSDFLRYGDRYSFLFDLEITDYKGWCYGLKKAGYATAPDYAQKLIKIIEDYKLYEYDRKVSFLASKSRRKNILPPTPSQLEAFMEFIPTKNSPMYKFSQNRKIYVRNNVPFIIAGNNETYESIAKEYNLFKRELLSFNDLKKDRPISPGTIVYIQRKRKRAPKHLEIHIAVEGDTYYDISQRYGVRLSKLFEYNDFSAKDTLYVGDEVFLRRHR